MRRCMTRLVVCSVVVCIFDIQSLMCAVMSVFLFLPSSTVAGQEDCWLLTETVMQTVSLQLKVCLNVQCLALHSFTDLHPGK